MSGTAQPYIRVRRHHTTHEPETNVLHRQTRDVSDDYDDALTKAGICFDSLEVED